MEPVLGLPDLSLQVNSQQQRMKPILSRSNSQQGETILSRSNSLSGCVVPHQLLQQEAASDQEEEEEEVEVDLGLPYGEGVVALHSLARHLAAKFLLRPAEKGSLVSDRVVRVSVKSLALSCISEVLLHQPQGSGEILND